MYIPLFYVQVYAIEKNIVGGDENLAFYLLAIANAGSFFGRTSESLAGEPGTLELTQADT